MSTEWRLFWIVILLLSSAFFSAAETAFFSLSRLELERLRESPRPLASRLLQLLITPRRVLTTLLLGNELTNVAIAVLSGSIIYDYCHHLDWRWPIFISIFSITPLLLVFGEIVPKTLALRYAPIAAPIMAVPVRWFDWLVTPFRWFLGGIADWCVRRFGGDPELAAPLIMEEEFRRLVDLGVAGGAIKTAEHDLIDRVFAFGDTCVGEWSTPISDVFCVSINEKFEQVVSQVRESGYSRVPIYDSDPKDIVGMIYARDLLVSYHHRKLGRIHELEDIVRPVLYMSQDLRVEDALRDFQKSRIHLAVITNAQQTVVGILTMDELLDRLFGLKGKS